MPMCYLSTNMKDDEVPDGFESKLAEKVSQVLKKGIEKVTVLVQTGLRISKKGDTGPMCTLQIHSIGVFDADRNPQYTQQLSEFLKKELGLPGERVTLLYVPLEAYNAGVGI